MDTFFAKPPPLIRIQPRPDRASKVWRIATQVVVFGGKGCPSAPQDVRTAIDEITHAFNLANHVAPGGGHICIESFQVVLALEEAL